MTKRGRRRSRHCRDSYASNSRRFHSRKSAGWGMNIISDIPQSNPIDLRCRFWLLDA